MSVASAAVSGLSVAAGPALLVGFAGGAGERLKWAWVKSMDFRENVPEFLTFHGRIHGFWSRCFPSTNPLMERTNDLPILFGSVAPSHCKQIFATRGDN